MTEADESPLLKGSVDRSAFISYSWTSEEHRQWVLELAVRLRGHGINVLLDRWHLKPGQDKYTFMERMVTDPTVKKVLIICDRRYQEKADKREGGVGDETLLITPEVYAKVDQDKFIPIIVELDEDSSPYMPAYLRSRLYIDMSVPANFESKYQELLRDLYGVPEITPPPLGTPPAYITGGVPVTLQATAVLQAAGAMQATATVTNPSVPVSTTRGTSDLIPTFLEAFVSDLGDFRFKPVPDEPFDETMTKLIERMKSLRDAFIWFAQRLARSELSQADHDRLRDYLERIAQFQYRPFEVREYHQYDWDNYRFLCYELFLILAAALLKQGKHADVATLVDSTYFYDSNVDRQVYGGITIFNHYVLSLDDVRNRRLNLRRVTITADMIKERAEGTDISFAELVNADLMLHYITFLRADAHATSWQSEVWFPRLSPYANHYESIPILRRLVSARQFERVKMLFGVDAPDELREAIERAMTEKSAYYQGMSSLEFAIPQLSYVVPLERIASVP
ncbi:MAG TPA: toll/interleukin-1 receptor domain-containing protein [Streptosporangiaceae bacterium]|jgi:hypothetical protein